VSLSRQQRRAKERAKAKKQKPRPAKPSIPSAPPSETLVIVRQPLWERIRDLPVWWIGGAAATILTLGGALWHVLQGPHVALADGDVTLPFAAPISVTNESWPFYMTDAQINCAVADVQLGRGRISGINFVFAGSTQTLEPGKPAIFQCSVTNGTASQVPEADEYVSVTYKMFGFWERQSDAMEITWFTGSNPPRWIVGHFPEPHM